MPRKVREVIQDLEHSGFVNHGGKGSHRNYKRHKGARITVSGKPGDDVKPYQEKALAKVLQTLVKEI